MYCFKVISYIFNVLHVTIMFVVGDLVIRSFFSNIICYHISGKATFERYLIRLILKQSSAHPWSPA